MYIRNGIFNLFTCMIQLALYLKTHHCVVLMTFSAIVQIKYPVLTKRNCVNYVYARSFSFGLMVIYSYVHFQSPTMESKSSQAENYIKDMKLVDHQLLSCLCFYVIVKHIGTHKLFASVVYNILSFKL